MDALPHQALQNPHPAAHPSLNSRSFLESHRDRVVIAVDWPVIIEAADRAAAKAMADADPYAKAGLFASVEIRAWKWLIKNPETK